MRASIYIRLAATGLIASSAACSSEVIEPPAVLAPAPSSPFSLAAPPAFEPAKIDLDPPAFDVERGFLDAPTSLALSSGDATIYYTTDGSTPTPEAGLRYSGPIPIETTTPLRAIAVTSGGLSSRVVTHTYLFAGDVVRQPPDPSGYPSRFAADHDGLGPYPADYEMDPEVVDDPRYSGGVEDALLDLPTLSIATDIANLFDEETGIYYNPMHEGELWERPASVEMFDPVDGSLFAAEMGIRIHGQASRKPSWTPKRGLRLYARSSYGSGRLELPLFEGAVTSFDKLVLRSIPNYSWLSWDDNQRENALYMRDEFARRTQLEMGGVTAHGRFVHTYLNGMYWGIYNLVERVDGDFLADYLGGADGDWDLVSMTNGVLGADEGDLLAYEEMMALANAGVASSSAYEAICEKLDVEDLADYLILTHWIANTDWPQRNWFAARKRELGAKYFFIAWDADTSLTKASADILPADLDGTPQRLFHALGENAEFRMLYADRIYAHLYNDGALTTPNGTARFTELIDALELAVTAESARWGDYVRDEYQRPDADPGILALYTPENYLAARDRMLTEYFPVRTATVIAQYRAAGMYPSIEPPQFSQLNDGAAVTVNIDNTPNAGEGTVYYRLDGGDPRDAGGAVSPSAMDGGDAATIPLNATTRVRARVLTDTTWSACHDATFVVGRAAE
jgi:hypothetical protein